MLHSIEYEDPESGVGSGTALGDLCDVWRECLRPRQHLLRLLPSGRLVRGGAMGKMRRGSGAQCDASALPSPHPHNVTRGKELGR